MENQVMDFTISLAHPEHFGMLRAIELAAFETLRNAGAVTGEAGASSLEELSEFSRNGLLLTAYTSDSVPVGFVAGKVEDIWLHIAEIDVHPGWQRHGIGRRLMQTLLCIGQQRGLTGATLTTDNMVAFNARFYGTLGFKIVEGLARPPHLVSLNADEIAKGFNPARRAAMCVTFRTPGGK
ncbi:GNAT family N-acetyltransferase [Yersinia sp. 1252 StPb PI]